MRIILSLLILSFLLYSCETTETDQIQAEEQVSPVADQTQVEERVVPAADQTTDATENLTADNSSQQNTFNEEDLFSSEVQGDSVLPNGIVEEEQTNLENEIPVQNTETAEVTEGVSEIALATDTQVVPVEEILIDENTSVLEDNAELLEDEIENTEEAETDSLILEDEPEVQFEDLEEILTALPEETLLEEQDSLLEDTLGEESVVIEESADIVDVAEQEVSDVVIAEAQVTDTAILENDSPVEIEAVDSASILTEEDEVVEELVVVQDDTVINEVLPLDADIQSQLEDVSDVIVAEQIIDNVDAVNVQDEQDAEIATLEPSEIIGVEPIQTEENLDTPIAIEETVELAGETLTQEELFPNGVQEEQAGEVLIMDNEQTITESVPGIATPVQPMTPSVNEDSTLSYEHVVPIEPSTLAQPEQEYEEIVQPIVISQTINAYEDEYADIILPGQGWIYLGEVKETSPSVLGFNARYIDGEDTLFNFNTLNQGSTVLHFYKQDVLADEYLDEYVQVNVNRFSGQAEPSYNSSSASSLADDVFGISTEPEVSLVFGEVQVAEEKVFAPEDILDQAQIAYDENRFSDSISLLDEYTSLGVDEVDRALFLYGQNYESTSDQRNIKQALASYKKIIDSFPDSTYWEDANKRIVYLERFYLNIR